ncbi:MAG TPA: IPT/TIG domain-containing protein [Bryobacteraceae bacterium]|nr:IPT/TIG domain-containing protein [Bryobacteraceae bacterium]
MILAALFPGFFASAQAIDNTTLNGKYFFRHVSLGTDDSGNLTDVRSLLGTLTFDGRGGYTFTGQQAQGTSGVTTQKGSGKYTITSGGFVTLDNPIRTGDTVNARYSPEAVLGSSTEATDHTYDLFVAIPAPTAATTNASLTGSYWTVTLEFPGGSAAQARNTIFNLASNGQGKLTDFSVMGHAANLSSGTPATQQVTGATYSMANDGSGTVTFGSAASLLSGSKSIYLSQDGNVILGGSTAAGSHDILIGVKAASNVSNATWNGLYWGAGLRFDTTTRTDYTGSAAAVGQGGITWSQRRTDSVSGAYDYTSAYTYSLKSDGSGTVLLTQAALGTGAKIFVGSTVNALDAGAYEIYFGAQMPAITGTGVYLSPVGVVNTASFAPAGTPISPGEFVSLYGSGLATSAQSATPPYPFTLDQVSVQINGHAAPVYYVSPTRLIVLVPYEAAGSTANIVAQNHGVNSNQVTVPLAPTSPGIFSVNQGGTGAGAILHADGSLVSTANPAKPGEIVEIFLTGMGAVDPPVSDGKASTGSPLNKATAPVSVWIADTPATNVPFSGLAPGFPGLYQINVQLPQQLSASGSLPLAIATPNAYHDQVDIATTQ